MSATTTAARTFAAYRISKVTDRTAVVIVRPSWSISSCGPSRSALTWKPALSHGCPPPTWPAATGSRRACRRPPPRRTTVRPASAVPPNLSRRRTRGRTAAASTMRCSGRARRPQRARRDPSWSSASAGRGPAAGSGPHGPSGRARTGSTIPGRGRFARSPARHRRSLPHRQDARGAALRAPAHPQDARTRGSP